MNFDNSWMVNYGSKLRKKGENFDNMCFESSKPTVDITRTVHKIRTTLKRRSNLPACIGKPLSPHSGKIPASSKAAAAAAATAAAILCQCIRERSPFFQRKKSFERTEFGLQVLDDRHADNTPSTLSSSSTYGSRPRRIRKRSVHTLTSQEVTSEMHFGSIILPVLRRRCQN